MELLVTLMQSSRELLELPIDLSTKLLGDGTELMPLGSELL